MRVWRARSMVGRLECRLRGGFSLERPPPPIYKSCIITPKTSDFVHTFEVGYQGRSPCLANSPRSTIHIIVMHELTSESKFAKRAVLSANLTCLQTCSQPLAVALRAHRHPLTAFARNSGARSGGERRHLSLRSELLVDLDHYPTVEDNPQEKNCAKKAGKWSQKSW